MLQIVQRPKESLHTILEENPNSESQGSTKTVTETAVVQPSFPPFRGGKIFNVSVDSPPWDGETDEDRAARINRNANHAQRQANEAAIVLAEAARNGSSNLLSHPFEVAGFLMSASTALHRMEKPMRTAQLVLIGMPTMRSAEQMRLPLC